MQKSIRDLINFQARSLKNDEIKIKKTEYKTLREDFKNLAEERKKGKAIMSFLKKNNLRRKLVNFFLNLVEEYSTLHHFWDERELFKNRIKIHRT